MKSIICVLAIALGICYALPSPAKDLRGNSNISLVRELYRKVNETIPSVVNAKENEKAIRSRLKCYEEYQDYTQRIHICNNAYTKEILRLARESVQSRPSLGEFAHNVGSCPIMYSMCMGQTENDKDRCILFERQCIDYSLDEFWRGSAQYTQQAYRLDQ